MLETLNESTSHSGATALPTATLRTRASRERRQASTGPSDGVQIAGEQAGTDGQTRRRLASRRRILAAARAAFVELGFDRTRPQDIARRAEVAIGTFYLHFKDKAEAFLAFAEQAQDELIADYQRRLEGVTGVRERMKTIVATMIDYADANPGVLAAAYLDPVMIAPRDERAWRLYDRMSLFLHLALDRAAADGHIDRSIDLPLVSHALCGLLRHGFIYAGRRSANQRASTSAHTTVASDAFDVDAVVDQLTRFITYGLAPGATASAVQTTSLNAATLPSNDSRTAP